MITGHRPPWPPRPEFSGKNGKHLPPVDNRTYTSSETRAGAGERS